MGRVQGEDQGGLEARLQVQGHQDGHEEGPAGAEPGCRQEGRGQVSAGGETKPQPSDNDLALITVYLQVSLVAKDATSLALKQLQGCRKP